MRDTCYYAIAAWLCGLAAAGDVHSDELVVSGAEDRQLVCRNLIEAGFLGVDDLTFEAGGLDGGLRDDVDTITLRRT